MFRPRPIYFYALGIFLGYFFKIKGLTIGYTILASFLVMVLIELLAEALTKKEIEE